MRISRSAGSGLFNIAVFEAVLASVESFYSRGRAVMSLPVYLKFINDPVVVLAVALGGLWILHKASVVSAEDARRDRPSLVDSSGNELSAGTEQTAIVGRKDIITTIIVAVGAVVLYCGWVLASPAIPAKQLFDEWATDFRRAVRSGESPYSVPAAESMQLAGINKVIQPIYARTLETLRDLLLSYRAKFPNMYILLPQTPLNILGSESAAYRGAVVFAKDCSWFLRMDSPVQGATRSGPILMLELMDGDGHAKGGRGVGTVSISYDFDNNRLAVSATGATNPILENLARSAAPNEVEVVVSTICRLLLEKQLRSCRVSESGR